MKQLVNLLIVVAGLWSFTSIAADAEYPHRPNYPDVQIYTVEKLAQDYNNVVIVDVRSRYEFDTLHIKGAVNIALNHDEFSAEIKKLSTEKNKPVVFYCNGKTCAKSYKGARQAARAGAKNLYAFDAGVFDWAKAKPELTVLLGKSPISPGDLISKQDLEVHMLSPKEFEKRVQQGGKISVIDVRDRIQRDILLFPLNETRITLSQEDELTAYIKKEAAAGKTLFIYDKVGKQVRWLQYRLNAMGIRNYYFLKGGSEAMYQAL